MERKYFSDRFFGLLLFVFSIFWTGIFLRLLYGYQFANSFFFYMIPGWLLFVSLATGIYGIISGLMIFRQKLKVVSGYLIAMLVLALNFLVLGLVSA